MTNKKPQQQEVVAYLEDAYKSRGSDLAKSVKLATKALLISRKLQDKKLVAQSLNRLSLFYMIKGEHAKSIAMADEALPLYQELKDEPGQADIKYNLAGIHYKTENFHLGLAYLIDCLVIYKKYKDYSNIARTEKSLGTIYEYIGDEKNALKSYENSIEAAVLAGDANLESNVYNPLSGMYLKKGQVKKALDLIDKSVAMKESSGDIRGLAFALYGRGKVYTRTGCFSEAEKDLKKALKIHEDVGEKLGIAMAYRKLGVLYEHMNKDAAALRIYRKAYKYSDENHIAIIKLKTAYHLYERYKKDKDIVRSLRFLEEYIKQREAVINTQTLKVIENYDMKSRIERMESEARLQKEKAEILEKKNLAEQASRVRQEFLSTMSHEIRTPLNAVTTISTLLKDRANPEEQQLLDSLRFASGNLLQIINDILDFTKLDTGKASLELRPSGLGNLMKHIYGTYNSLAVEKGLNLVLDIDTKLADGYMLDETKLSQILGNLVSNSVKYTEKGQVSIVLSLSKTAEGFDWVKFSVKDTGMGISAQNLKRIFEEFFQPEAITTRKEKGTGLGLAIVKKLVELYGSSIHAKSKIDKGSEFYFTLKLQPAQLQPKAAERAHDRLQGKRVLLAEDNPINALVATKLLTNWGVQTEHAVNGLYATVKAAEKKYDYILMDLHMPDMNGYDATRAIRESKGLNAGTPIYALTADITADQQEEYIALFNGFLRKPIEIENLYEALAGN